MVDAKRVVAEKAVSLVSQGMTIGLGSGSTANLAIEKLGERVRNGLVIKAVASSLKSERLARASGIDVVDPSQIQSIDLSLDGADEVDLKGNLLKGGGGSLLREKIVAFASRRFHVMVDESKLVQQLGRFPLAVEVIPFGVDLTLAHIRSLGCTPSLRTEGGKIFVTDNGNHIADCSFGTVADPAALDMKLKMIPGVVETGLFSFRIVTSVFVGYRNGEVKELAINR